MDQIVVHDYDKRIGQQNRLLEEARISPANRATIKDFINHCATVERLGGARIVKYMFSLRRIAEQTNKPFKKLTEKDINDILVKLENQGNGHKYSEYTIQDYRKAISKFWRWLFYDEYSGEAPPPIRRLKVSFSTGKKEPVIYSKDEIRKLIECMPTIRDKAFFACLYDLQCRVSELLSRRMKDVRYTEGGDIQIFVEADKTKNSHWETLFESVGKFNTWLRMHPKRDDPDAPLWTMHRRIDATPFTYPAARSIFVKTCKKHNLRRLRIHTLRKSKATHDLADGVPISYIESRGSWSKGSKALQDCYISIQQLDKDNAYKKKYNMTVKSEPKEALELRRCARCEAVMENNMNFCSRCGMPVNAKIAQETIELANRLPEMIDKNMLSELVKKMVLEELRQKSAEK